MNVEKFLRAPILKKICERLLLKVFLEHFPTWTNNMGSEEDVFSKSKKKSVLKQSGIWKKTCLFMMFFIISFFCISLLHVRWRFPYIIKYGNSEVFLNQWVINLGPVEKLSYLFTYAFHLVLTYYLNLWARKCFIVICIVITNTKFVARRCI